VTYAGNTTFEVDIPGGSLVTFKTGTVTSLPAGATFVSYAANKLTINAPLPALGLTTVIKFVVVSDCNIVSLAALPFFTTKVTYPASYPSAAETFNSAQMNVGAAQLVVVDNYGNNGTVIFGVNNASSLFISNTGYGNIDNVKITVTRPTTLPATLIRIWTPATGVRTATDWPPTTTTVVGSNTVEVLTLSGNYLGPDKLLTPGEAFEFVR
jgi:hypothetical protein